MGKTGSAASVDLPPAIADFPTVDLGLDPTAVQDILTLPGTRVYTDPRLGALPEFRNFDVPLGLGRLVSIGDNLPHYSGAAARYVDSVTGEGPFPFERDVRLGAAAAYVLLHEATSLGHLESVGATPRQIDDAAQALTLLGSARTANWGAADKERRTASVDEILAKLGLAEPAQQMVRAMTVRDASRTWQVRPNTPLPQEGPARLGIALGTLGYMYGPKHYAAQHRRF